MNWPKLDYLLLALLFLGCTTITSILAYFIPLNILILGWLAWGLVATFITLVSLRISEERRPRIFSNLRLLLNIIGFILYPLIVVLLIFVFIIGLFSGNGDSLDIPSPFDMGDLFLFLFLVIFGTMIPMPFIVRRLNCLGISNSFSVSIFLATVSLGVVLGTLIKLLILDSAYSS